MKIGFYLLLAIGNMWRHKLRTGLTLLGLVVGITSVLVMSGIGKGFAQQMGEEFSSLLANKLTLRTGFLQEAGEVPMTLDDAEKLANQIEHSDFTSVVPEARISDISIKGIDLEGQFVDGTATTAEYVHTVQWTVRQGRFFTPEEEEREATVVVINQVLADIVTEQGGELPDVLTINNLRFTLVGVVDEEDTFFGGFPKLFVPIHLLERQRISQSARRHNGSLVVDAIHVMATNSDRVEAAKQDVERIMRLAQNRKADEPNSFSLQSENDFLQITENFNRGFTLVLGGIGAISLIVGGIGVMNIMLAAIAERTREVGLRKAIGATNLDILFQFLTESVTICLVGGLLGILISYALASTLAIIFPEGGNGPGIRIVVDLSSILIAVASSTISGIIFGIYPALRAMRLRPIEALRYE